MASAGPNYAGTEGFNTSSGGGRNWSTLGNNYPVGTPDGIGVESTLLDSSFGATNQFSWYLLLTNFHFAIPSGSTINGVSIAITRKASASGVISDYLLKMVIAGSPAGSSFADTATMYTTSYVTATYGSSTTIPGGNAPTAADINASNFGIALAPRNNASSGGGVNANVDAASITVYYTAPPSTGGGIWAFFREKLARFRPDFVGYQGGRPVFAATSFA